MAGLLLASATASALPTISMVWRDTGTPTIGTPAVASSSFVLADVVITSDTTGVGVNGVFISIEFDPDELFAVGGAELPAVNLPGMANSYAPLSLGTGVDNVNGLVEGFDQATLAFGLGDLGTHFSVTLGSVRFHVTNPVGDASDIDVIASLQNMGVDEIATNLGPGSAIFQGASLTGSVIPEPATVLLVVVGLAVLAHQGMRDRR